MGQTLSATTGTWSNRPTSYGFEWQRCTSACGAIAGAGASRYGVQLGDVGSRLRVVVRAVNASGSRTKASVLTATVTTAPSSGLHAAGNQLLDANNTGVHLHGVN